MIEKQLLSGRAAVVVGGGSGIGAAVAELLSRHGAGVVVNSRSGQAVARTVERIRELGGEAVGFAGSAADMDTAQGLVSACVDAFGGIDILVNCAGIAEPPRSSILEVSPAEWQALLDSHLTTVFNTCRVAAPLMAAGKGGSIINTGSFAYLGDYGGTGYPAGKGAVTSLSLAMAAELKEHRVRVNTVCPGAKTRLSTGPDYEAHIQRLHERGLLDEVTMRGSLDAPPPEYAAALYLYLAADISASITGEVFIAAGGFVGRFPRPAPEVLGYRDHLQAEPWSVTALATMLDGR
ncbi:SDR family NAD(P)-dependent oxidoreductase [Nocardia sp. SYP-A9097]|uniref:SDR family NAD(P)-dependent oxidoreductase n=1 Tax=Nocardia sp. SYP-A9097 TaxID=2663237 RepID=UPI00129A35CE|nr:SDR family oxidoreductase [Nocardia sp. SYP-A9097]MRH91289.1 SDR family NAD(P)-dependent oxidoreductase [Nocardia sp. SYP-A9097]